MIDISIKTDDLDKLRWRLDLIPNAIPTAIRRATKRTASKGKTNIIRQITDASNIKPKIAKEKSRDFRFGSTGAAVELRKTGRLGIRHFKGTQDEQGVFWQVGKDDQYKFMPRGFTGPTRKISKIATVTGKGKNREYKRLESPKTGYITDQSSKWKGNAFVRAGKKRLPIVKVMGVSPWGFFTRRKMTGPAVEDLTKHLRERLVHEAKFILGDL